MRRINVRKNIRLRRHCHRSSVCARWRAVHSEDIRRGLPCLLYLKLVRDVKTVYLGNIIPAQMNEVALVAKAAARTGCVQPAKQIKWNHQNVWVGQGRLERSFLQHKSKSLRPGRAQQSRPQDLRVIVVPDNNDRHAVRCALRDALRAVIRAARRLAKNSLPQPVDDGDVGVGLVATPPLAAAALQEQTAQRRHPRTVHRKRVVHETPRHKKHPTKRVNHRKCSRRGVPRAK